MTMHFYTNDEMMKYFGTLTPTLEERTILFSDLWKEYRENELSLKGYGLSISQINDIRKMYGPFNVVRQGLSLRFKYREDLLFVTLKYVKKNK